LLAWQFQDNTVKSTEVLSIKAREFQPTQWFVTFIQATPAFGWREPMVHFPAQAFAAPLKNVFLKFDPAGHSSR